MNTLTLSQQLTQIVPTVYDGSVLVLAAWRFSNLLSNEAGPFHMFRHIRQWAMRQCRRVKWCREFGLAEWTQCEYCNSVAICIALWLGWLVLGHVVTILLTPFAMSTVVILIKRTHEQLQR